MDEGQEDAFSEEILALVRDGRKIEAIKLMRERFSLDLAQAKEAVDRIQEIYAPREVVADADGAVPKEQFELEIVSLLRQRQWIEAIRRYRNRYGTGLMESKQAVEQIAAERGLDVQSSGGGCSSAAIFLFAVPAGCMFWLFA